MSERRISHYRILEPLGKGGMGEVYAAEDETLRRKVALKSIRSEVRLEPELRARFLREARVLSQLDHPNICRIFDYLSTSDGDFIVLELIEGVDLASVIAAGVSRKQALSIALELADVLAAAHAAGVVHRDIKPGNVMITTGGVTKVLDFGLSRIRGDAHDLHDGAVAAPRSATPQRGGRGTLIWEIEGAGDGGEGPSSADSVRTRRGGLLGTPRYMSPEQARGELVTAAVDMYALGLVLQELFTGEPAHDPRSTGIEVLERTRLADSAPVRGLSRDLTALITALKSPDPALRPTAHEVGRRLRWIQRKPQRWLRRALAATALLVAASGATKYTLDLKRERARAEGRTEAALAMMETLFQQQVPVLAEVGRLDAFDAAAEGVQAYFAGMPREELTDGELLELAKLLMLVGQVRESQGRPADAKQSFAEALTLTSELETRLPGDSEVVLARGAAHFYLGQVALRGLADPAGALACFREYHAAARRNEAVDPDPVNAARELTYARNAIAGALLALGRAPEALAEQEEIVRFLRTRSADGPGREDLRADLADNLSWLGSARFDAGKADDALLVFEEELELRRARLAADPHGTAGAQPAPDLAPAARASLSYCLTFVAKVQLARGHPDLAVAPAIEARDRIAELHAADPQDAGHARSLHIALQTCSEALHAASRTADTRHQYATSVELGERLLARDPKDSALGRTLVTLLLDAAEANLASVETYGEVERLAARAIELAAAVPEMPLSERQVVQLRVQDARGGVKAGRGDLDGAHEEWALGLVRLAEQPAGTRTQRVRTLEALLLARLGRKDEAASIAAELPPHDPWVRTVREVLEQR